LAGLLDGFEEYLKPTEDESISALKTSLVVPDTNVLLNLYKYNANARREMLVALEKIGDRLWLPNQVLVEFWRSRRNVLVDIKGNYKGMQKSLETTRRQALDTLTRWARMSASSPEEVAARTQEVNSLFEGLRSAVEKQIHELVEPDAPTSSDQLLADLTRIFQDRVESATDSDSRASLIEVAVDRANNKIPPGYADAAKGDGDSPDGGAGDYLVWHAATTEARTRGLDLTIITGDIKEDWWVRQQELVIGPRPELLREFRDLSAGRSLYLLQPRTFLSLAAKALDVEVSPATIENVDNVDDGVPDEDSSARDKPWTGEEVDALLNELDAEGAFQAEVIREAARLGGRIDREAIYRIAQRDEAQLLRGITRPVTRVTQLLISHGVIRPGTCEMFTVNYEGKFLSNIEIPAEVTRHLSLGKA
jgi:hypothetical protein